MSTQRATPADLEKKDPGLQRTADNIEREDRKVG